MPKLAFPFTLLLAAACSEEPPLEICGDATIHAGEECDDGNDVADDGCNNDCEVTFTAVLDVSVPQIGLVEIVGSTGRHGPWRVPDLNGDGLADIAVGDYRRALFLFGRPDFFDRRAIDFAEDEADATVLLPHVTHNYVSVTDFDGDGEWDLVVESQSTVRVYTTRWQQVLTDPIPATVDLSQEAPDFTVELKPWPRIELLDLNGDGRADILSGNHVFFGRDLPTPVAVAHSDPDVSFVSAADRRVQAACDLDADGNEDLAVIPAPHGAFEIFLGGSDLLGEVDLDARSADLVIYPVGENVTFAAGGCVRDAAEPLFALWQQDTSSDADCAWRFYYFAFDAVSSRLSGPPVPVSALNPRYNVSCAGAIGGFRRTADVDGDGVRDWAFAGHPTVAEDPTGGLVFGASDGELDLSEVAPDVTVVVDDEPVFHFWPVGDLDGDRRADLMCNTLNDSALVLIQGKSPPPVEQ